jgi:hypothetical protein
MTRPIWSRSFAASRCSAGVAGISLPNPSASSAPSWSVRTRAGSGRFGAPVDALPDAPLGI